MKKRVLERLATLMIGAFGLVAALAWNDAVRGLFAGPCGSEKAGPLCFISQGGPWIYAVVVTIIAVIATMWIGKLADKKEKK
ncbi:MAG: DUF5654 family protein [Candidatus Woesearchaeota archaeon]